ncbi:MAG: SlyX family protein [Pirellulales bacterium]
MPDKSSSSPTEAQRIHALEEQLAFQQHTVDGLEETVRGQQTQLEHLKSQLEQMRGFVERLSSGELGQDLPHEKPPHY